MDINYHQLLAKFPNAQQKLGHIASNGITQNLDSRLLPFLGEKTFHSISKYKNTAETVFASGIG